MFNHGRKIRDTRRQLNAPGWLTVSGGFGVARCTVIDISDSGARLRVANPSKLPKVFSLTFSLASRNGRYCRVVWRDGDQVGVEFRPPEP